MNDYLGIITFFYMCFISLYSFISYLDVYVCAYKCFISFEDYERRIGYFDENVLIIFTIIYFILCILCGFNIIT